MKKELSLGFKIWFWLILIFNSICFLLAFPSIACFFYLATTIGAIGLLNLKKWGFWSIAVFAMIWTIVSMNPQGIIFPLAIYWSLKRKKHYYWGELD